MYDFNSNGCFKVFNKQLTLFPGIIAWYSQKYLYVAAANIIYKLLGNFQQCKRSLKTRVHNEHNLVDYRKDIH